ncbi:MAG: F0F1 ATP synthase subunit gamma [Burkholderiaceae bacterium]|jgi:F-type H+-transporting ATPase subunit gamma|uniref:F0F1 ATP synthase subunit gamma n=1 Tax=Polynucleobacter sp. HIN8 TaxID=3047867 RepID=UPI001D243293|nr:F0F1 ATP synthase subunit gamma [Polynucleobacter sp. HIN8]MBU3726092.1 F0F1 ATP synthase subunit gamma [Polynucleobacter sp.]NBO84920.1 F0F1 ATP synthase subunit gamma [Burkholderiaceae bacterium]NBP18896.1 F0F1 ATP synthase subunit gamma [Burkholderiaceae bacterium]NBP96929.1 F0F1 ATP synthase subunit gamma [Burkholderiaceae bacterium]NCA08989.1 F0F1 ATP synthase subunit gamma [Burkholderiaceae bacterium]
MASTKEIRSKIKSVQNTRKITKAMEMVAASKMRRAQERMRAARPYSEKIRIIASHLANANPEYRPVYMAERDVKAAGVIVVSTDKGLCGGLNTNVFRVLTNQIREFKEKNISTQFTAIGSKGFQFLNRAKAKILSQSVHLGDTPHMDILIGAITAQLEAFERGEVDAVYLAYTRFVNTMKQEPVLEKLLPLSGDELAQDANGKAGWDYIYEPDAESILNGLLKRYIEALIYQAVAENMASEQSARMVAMKAASDNAKNVIGELQLTYNKTRQAAITKELSEIVGGAAAV